MGRSVLTPTHSELDVFLNFEYPIVRDDEEEPVLDRNGYEQIDDLSLEFEWDYFVDSITETLKKKYPSLVEIENQWIGNECRVILGNHLVNVTISEYCGVVAVSIVPVDDLHYYDEQGLATGWIKRVSNGFTKLLETNFNAIRKIGTYANGNSVYQKVHL